MAAKKKEAKQKREYRLIKKKSGRYAVMRKGKLVNGLDKVKILLQEGLIKTNLPKAKAESEG